MQLFSLFSSAITCINVKEPSTKEAKDSGKKAERVTLKQTFNIIKQNDQLKVFIGVVLCMNLMLQLLGGYGTLLLQVCDR